MHDEARIETPDVSDINDLRIRLNQTLVQLDVQIDTVQAYCVGDGIRPTELRDRQGNWVMIPLLTAKAQVLVALLDISEVVDDGEER